MTSSTYNSTTDLSLANTPPIEIEEKDEILYRELLDIHNAIEKLLSTVDIFIDRERAYSDPVIIGDYTILITDKLILVDSTAGAINITLPLISLVIGYDFDIKHILGANTVKLFGDSSGGAEKVEGSTLGITIPLGDSITVKNDSVEWWII